MSQIVNMLDAKSSLSKLVHDRQTGGADEFVIPRNGQPATRVVPLMAAQADRSRRICVAKGGVKVPDDIGKHHVDLAKLFRGD